MGGLTPPKKPLTSKMQQKALKCTVELEIRAITCPGAVLLAQEDVYLSARILGQYHKTKCVPPVFPLLLHEKMVFVKTFRGVFDPGDVADLLENDATYFELIQLVPPEGDILATIEESTREFLYPGPRLTPKAPSPEREMLMKRSISFPGISPKVEFSTTSIIEECDVKDSQATVSPINSSSVKPGRGQSGPGPAANKEGPSPPRSYARPTVASRTRSPSPYTHRQMCQLSEDARQRLSHLRLGPHAFRKETMPQPPFVVPQSPSASLIESPAFHSPSPPKKSPLRSRSACSAANLTGLIRGASLRMNGASPWEVSREGPGSPPRCRVPAEHSTPVSSIPRGLSPLLTRSSLRERFQSDGSSPSHCEEIHRRVEKILKTNSARCRLSFDEQIEEGEDAEPGPALSCHGSLCDSLVSQDRRLPGDPSAHSHSGTFRTNKASLHTGKPHRAVFEDSLSKIYKTLYRKASSSTDFQTNPS
ncbi:spermatogenesis-associated protein 6 [Chanos chanos]|uniref:Spermatogenesis-associated protein 6 n=1 Tax=Chanos chanos TaxID=29144 RepID=A0A6J2W7G6_CHACN|nr:spermatogenesis-associated protein 6 [Chanos chanos]